MRIKEKNANQPIKKQSPLLIQKQLILKTLASGEGVPCWKILVFDAYNRTIVSSQLKMKDLRDHNITLYLNLTDNREQIHGVTVQYLLQPTIENVELIAQDLIKDLYSHVYIHFSSEPPAAILSALAKTLSSSPKSSAIARIAKMEYSCIGFYPVDHSMCILPTELEIVNFLTAMMLQPIFVFNPLNASSRELVEKVKTKLSTLTGTISISIESRPPQNTTTNYIIIYIFNRETDYFPVLAHGITYASLLENIYKINKTANKLIKTNNKQTNELSLQDQIWVEKKNYLIHQMQLEKQSNKMESKIMGISSEDYSQYNEKLRKIQWHLNNAGELISEAKKRRLNEFYEVEEDIYNKGLLSKETKRDFQTLLKEGQDTEDKTRLMLIYVLCCDNIDEVKELQHLFPDIVKNKHYNEMKEKKVRGSVGQSASNKYIKKLAKGIWKNLIPGDKKFRITKELEKVKSSTFEELIEGGLAVEGLGILPTPSQVQRNMVHCLGGVCFHEYANVLAFDCNALYTGDQLISYRQIM